MRKCFPVKKRIETHFRKGVEIQRGVEFTAFLREMGKQVMNTPIQCRKTRPFSFKKVKYDSIFEIPAIVNVRKI